MLFIFRISGLKRDLGSLMHATCNRACPDPRSHPIWAGSSASTRAVTLGITDNQSCRGSTCAPEAGRQCDLRADELIAERREALGHRRSPSTTEGPDRCRGTAGPHQSDRRRSSDQGHQPRVDVLAGDLHQLVAQRAPHGIGRGEGLGCAGAEPLAHTAVGLPIGG